MLACLAKISPLYRLTGERADVRVSSVNDLVSGPLVNGAGGRQWEPAMVNAPVLTMTVWNGDFADAVSVGNASLVINLRTLKETFPFADDCAWIGAPVVIYAEKPGTAWPWRERFVGKVSGFGIKGDTLTLGCQVDLEPFNVDVLPSTYAGTGGAEGSADNKGQVKPLVIGSAKGVQPVLINAVNSVYQFSGYGAIEAVSALFERGASFGSAIGDYANYAALVAATIAPGRWATCLAEGMVRLGAPEFGVITGDVIGHKIGAASPTLTGEVIAALAEIAGVNADALNAETLAALDLEKPYSVGVVLSGQTRFADIAREMALYCNYQAGVGFDGRFTVIQITFGQDESMTFNAVGKSWPQVKEAAELDVSPPFWKTIIGANRCWRVHSSDEIAFAAQLVDRGRYDATESYREGHMVDVADGSRWLYVNPVASTGNAPPTWPIDSDAYWDILNPPTFAEDIAFNDGQSVEDLKPAEAGATLGAPTGTPVGGITSDDVADTINSGGGVADNQVTTTAIVADSVTVPDQATNGSTITGTGSSQVAVTLNVTMAEAGYIIVVASNTFTYSSGARTWALELVIDGNVAQSMTGNMVGAGHCILGSMPVAAGMRTVTLNATMQDSTVSINPGAATMIVLRRYR
jgi:hypothetical protein